MVELLVELVELLRGNTPQHKLLHGGVVDSGCIHLRFLCRLLRERVESLSSQQVFALRGVDIGTVKRIERITLLDRLPGELNEELISTTGDSSANAREIRLVEIQYTDTVYVAVKRTIGDK